MPMTSISLGSLIINSNRRSNLNDQLVRQQPSLLKGLARIRIVKQRCVRGKICRTNNDDKYSQFYIDTKVYSRHKNKILNITLSVFILQSIVKNLKYISKQRDKIKNHTKPYQQEIKQLFQYYTCIYFLFVFLYKYHNTYHTFIHTHTFFCFLKVSWYYTFHFVITISLNSIAGHVSMLFKYSLLFVVIYYFIIFMYHTYI